MKRFIMVSLLVMMSIKATTPKTTTPCPRPPCFYCQPYGTIDFGLTPPCHGCECNPCQYGQPLLKITCAHGNGKCAAINGTCKINSANNIYCCPNEHQGCCPPRKPGMGPCYALCAVDSQCKEGQKCCGGCPRTCQNATLT